MKGKIFRKYRVFLKASLNPSTRLVEISSIMKGKVPTSSQDLYCLTTAKDTSVGNSCVEQFAQPRAGGSQTVAVAVSWGCSILLESPSRTLDSPLGQSLKASHSQPKGHPPASERSLWPSRFPDEETLSRKTSELAVGSNTHHVDLATKDEELCMGLRWVHL